MNWLEYHKEPVTLHSGDKSRWLVRADLIYEDEELREAVLRHWVHWLGYHAGYREFLGITNGGVVWAHAIAECMNGKCYELDVPQLVLYGHLLRSGARDSTAQHPLVVVDDVTTTGKCLSLVPHANDYLVVVDRRLEIPGVNKVGAWAHLPLPLIEGDDEAS
jgi:orotate phosphoribosyltransferase